MSEPDYREFALGILGEWPDLGAWDPFEIEELATECGLLIPTKRTTFCMDPETEEGEMACSCSEYYTTEETARGFTCLRLHSSLSRRNGR